MENEEYINAEDIIKWYKKKYPNYIIAEEDE